MMDKSYIYIPPRRRHAALQMPGPVVLSLLLALAAASQFNVNPAAVGRTFTGLCACVVTDGCCGDGVAALSEFSNNFDLLASKSRHAHQAPPF